MSFALSAVIITKNEERNLAKCLESLCGIASEIIVADSRSTDATPQIAEQYGARVVTVAWKGYAATKNEANQLATNDWILSLDADEELSPQLRQQFVKLLQGPPPSETEAFELQRLAAVGGKFIRHSGWYPDRKVRLFNRKHAKWEGEYVHETLVTAPGAKITRLEGHCFHYTAHSVSDLVATANKYSNLRAQEMFANGKRAGVFHLWVKPWAEFWISYLVRGGFRDGTEGLLISYTKAYEKFLKYAKLRVLQRQARETNRTQSPSSKQ